MNQSNPWASGQMISWQTVRELALAAQVAAKAEEIRQRPALADPVFTGEPLEVGLTDHRAYMDAPQLVRRSFSEGGSVSGGGSPDPRCQAISPKPHKTVYARIPENTRERMLTYARGRPGFTCFELQQALATLRLSTVRMYLIIAENLGLLTSTRSAVLSGAKQYYLPAAAKPMAGGKGMHP